MTPEAIDQIRTSHAEIASLPRQLASRFYQELFSAAPHLRPLFPADLTALQGHFEAALALVVRNHDAMPALRESLRELGAEHVQWGATPEAYLAAREAIIGAVRSLAPAWNDTLERHWRTAITAIIVPMLEGAAVDAAMWAERLAADTPEID